MRKLFHNRKYRLSTLLIGLVSASFILTAVILLLAAYQSEKESVTDTYFSSNFSKANKISSSVNSLFGSMRNSLEETASYLSKKNELSDEQIQEQLQLLRNSSTYFNSLAWVDETGLVRNIAPLSVGLKGKYIDTGLTKEVLDSKEPALTSPYIAPSGRLIVLMSEPLYDKQGIYRGIIGGTIYLQEHNVLNEILGNDIADESGSYYYVVGPGGRLLFHPEPKRIGEEVLENPIVRKVIGGESGIEEVINTKGVSMLAAYSSIPGADWGVVQQTPVSYVDELLADHFKDLLVYILPFFFLLMLLSIFIARKLAEPFIQLADVVNRMGEGHAVTLPEYVSHWNREADLLTTSVRIALNSVQQNKQQLEQEALTDPLTGVYNRRKMEDDLERLEHAGKTFSLVALDIDHFKVVNDTFGHQAGDEVLKFLTRTVGSLLKEQDQLFRYGGEEFVVLLPDTTGEEAFQIAELLRHQVETSLNPIKRPLTISLGIAEFPHHTHSAKELFRFADKALYEAKESGRNRTILFSLDDPSNPY